MILVKASQINYAKTTKSWGVKVAITSLDSGTGIIAGSAQSSTDPNLFYEVFFFTKHGEVSCTCPGFVNTGTPCKHICALGLISMPLLSGISPGQIQR